MPLDDALIYKRVEYLLQQIFENLTVIGQIDGNEVEEWVFDYENFAESKRFATKWLQLADGNRIMLCEEYDIEEYELKIVRYAYIYSDMNGSELLRAENAHPHNVFTDPHHIHDFRFGKSKKPKPFQRQDLDNPDITEFFAHIRGNRL
ncbi:hypothetical protein FJZ31_23065 [Candidatus Poribacteria bacterium]|nr:hypothetical protein [Candidatus Poribacteria bacterium]